jgi:exopolysaccharide biosynthesis predicted pyruvyltransferase EpsI
MIKASRAGDKVLLTAAAAASASMSKSTLLTLDSTSADKKKKTFGSICQTMWYLRRGHFLMGLVLLCGLNLLLRNLSVFHNDNSTSLTLQNSSNNNHQVQMIDNRKQCIQAIRARHDEILLPWIAPQTKSNNNNKSNKKSPNLAAKSILLVDPSYHDNVGDQMLTSAEQVFLHQIGWNKNNSQSHLECNYLQAKGRAPSCSENIQKYATQVKVALWHAGGNWGNIWQGPQAVRIQSFVELLQAGLTIVGMPQSLFYSDDNSRKTETEKFRQNIQNGLKLTELDSPKSRKITKEKLIFTWREVESYEQAQKLYPFATNQLVPDIAFQLGPFQPIRPKNPHNMVDLVLFLRADKESKIKKDRNRETIQALLNDIPGGQGLTFIIVDWIDRLKLFPGAVDRKTFDHESIKLLSLGRVVVCDRLHASILAYLSGLPFVYLDQVSNKLTKTLGVAFSSWEGCSDEEKNMLVKATSLKDSLEKAVDMMNTYGLHVSE